MTPSRERIEAIFDAAIDLPTERRAQWLEGACAGDTELYADVLALIEAHERTEGILERDPRPIAETLQLHIDEGRRIGPYRVVHELGRGGMGVVYLALREDGQFRQRVALKLLRGSPDAQELYSRFLAERQILAGLRHPGISQLLDGGIADGQLPYLVMEYVDGVPITVYCDRHRLDLTRRLRLFQRVCDAADHAHKNLVLHRDLKPGNILVTADEQVKLLDFGIAKLLNPVLSGLEAPITRTDQRVLTPEFASPEQIRGEPLTTASDVYSLGVVLYQMLSGQPPYRLTTRSPHELAELICEREPPRPSIAAGRASSQSNSTTDASAAPARDTSPERLQRELRGDLDEIVLKALRKEPARRYGSAEQFSQDIDRYLDGLPVLAQRGSRRYRAGKFVRRHRVEVAAAALVVASLVAGGGVALWQASLARAERDRAEAALAEVEVALRESQEIARFLTSLFDASDPVATQGAEMTARDLLRRGIRQADQLQGQPLVQATMFDVLGRVQNSLGDYADARRLFERSLELRLLHQGGRHRDVAHTLTQLASAQRYLGLYAEGEAGSRRALAILESLPSPPVTDLVETLIQISLLIVYRGDLAEADTLARRAVRISESAAPVDARIRARALIQQGSIDRRQGEYAQAESSFRSAIALTRARYGPDHASSLDALLQLGYLLWNIPARIPEAESIFRSVLDVRRRTLGPEHLLVAQVQHDIGYVLQLQNRHDEALSFYTQGYALYERALGPQHPQIAMAKTAVALAYDNVGRYAEAERLHREAVALSERLYGPQHSVTAGALSALALTLAKRGNYGEAERLQRRSMTIRTTLGGPNTTLMARMLANMAQILTWKGDYLRAESMLKQAAAIFDSNSLPLHHPEYRFVFERFVQLYDSWNKPELASRYRSQIPPQSPLIRPLPGA